MATTAPALPVAYRPQEVAELLGISRRSVSRMIASGRIPTVAVGAGNRHHRIPRNWLDEQLAGSGRPSTATGEQPNGPNADDRAVAPGECVGGAEVGRS